MDIVNVEIQENLAQIKSQGETEKMGDPVWEETKSQPCVSEKETIGKGDTTILVPVATH